MTVTRLFKALIAQVTIKMLHFFADIRMGIISIASVINPIFIEMVCFFVIV